MKSFREDLFLRMVCIEIFREDEFPDSSVSRYLLSTYFRESRKVTYRIEYISSDHLIGMSHSKIIKTF